MTARPAHARCDLCPRQGCTPLRPDGSALHASFAVIGSEPSQQEVRRGGPADGSAFVRLLRMIEESFRGRGRVMDRREAWLTYAALCPPVGRHESELRKAVACCRPRLVAELKTLTAHTRWLLLGKTAWYAVSGKTTGFEGRTGFHQEIGIAEVDELARADIDKLEAKAARAAKGAQRKKRKA